jgi:hypothetical protein
MDKAEHVKESKKEKKMRRKNIKRKNIVKVNLDILQHQSSR